VYQRCVIALQEELAVDPAEATLRLLEQIRADRCPTPILIKPQNEYPPAPQPLAPYKVSLIELVSRLRRIVSALTEMQHLVQREVRTVESLLPDGRTGTMTEQHVMRK